VSKSFSAENEAKMMESTVGKKMLKTVIRFFFCEVRETKNIETKKYCSHTCG